MFSVSMVNCFVFLNLSSYNLIEFVIILISLMYSNLCRYFNIEKDLIQAFKHYLLLEEDWKVVFYHIKLIKAKCILSISFELIDLHKMNLIHQLLITFMILKVLLFSKITYCFLNFKLNIPHFKCPNTADFESWYYLFHY